MRAMNSEANTSQNLPNWGKKEVYEKINKDINEEWPQWKKQVYNEMFVSAHAKKIVITR